jgi:hypothetical protein
MSLKHNKFIIESRVDGYINATQLCQVGNKRFNDWSSLNSTKKLIEALKKDFIGDTNILVSKNMQLIDVKKGNSTKFKQGTWIHPDLAVQLAQWVDPVFAIKVSRWIRELMTTGYVQADTQKTNEELIKLRQEVLVEKELRLIEQKRNIKHTQFHGTPQSILKNEIFYICTTPTYAASDRFEYGGVANKNDLKKRLASYGTGRAEGDLMYYTKIYEVTNYVVVERMLDSLVKFFKDKQNSKKEMVHMRYECFVELVEYIIECCNKSVDFMNKNSYRFLQETIENDTVVPLPCEEYTKKNIEKIKKINVKNTSADDQIEIIKNIINIYATKKLNNEYDIDYDDDRLHIEWSEIKNLFDTYVGFTKTFWRERLEESIKDYKYITFQFKKVK